MSYDPGAAYRSNNYDSSSQQNYGGGGYPPPPPRVSQRYTGRQTSRPRPGGFGCGSFFLGFLVASLLAAVVFFFFFIYNPTPATPFIPPADQPGTPDLNVTLSQSYLNREIKRQFTEKPVQVGLVEIREMAINVLDNSMVDVQMRAVTGPITFEMAVTQQMYISDGQIRLNAVGQPRLMSGQLPPGVNGIVNLVNSQFIEPQINQQVAQIVVNKRSIRLLSISTVAGLITVKANVT